MKKNMMNWLDEINFEEADVIDREVEAEAVLAEVE